MNLLLLLSALLSALTGVNAGGGHAPVAAAQVTAQVARATSLAAPRASHAPVQALDILAPRLASAPLVRLPRFDLPAYAIRRRE